MDFSQQVEIVQYEEINDSMPYEIRHEEIQRRPYFNPELIREKLVNRSIGNLGYQVNQKLTETSTQSTFFSPLSLSSVLGMILKAMPEDRKEQCLSQLGLGLLSEELVHTSLMEIMQKASCSSSELFSFRYANALAAPKQIGIFPKYQEEIASIYEGEIFEIDLDPSMAADKINAWVSEKTDQEITTLVSPNDLDPLGSFALLNALYFDGIWEHKFNPAVLESFYLSNGSEVTVLMMDVKKQFKCFDGDRFKMVEIPYLSPEGHSLSHLIFLPDDGCDLPNLEKRLTADFVQECRNAARVKWLNLKMPKLCIRERIDSLLDIFEDLGLPLKGELPFLAHNAELVKIVHQAKLTTDEKGTKATAATAAIGICKAYPMPPVELFHVNRDYAFYIVDNETILFQGNVKDESVFEKVDSL